MKNELYAANKNISMSKITKGGGLIIGVDIIPDNSLDL